MRQERVVCGTVKIFCCIPCITFNVNAYDSFLLDLFYLLKDIAEDIIGVIYSMLRKFIQIEKILSVIFVTRRGPMFL